MGRDDDTSKVMLFDSAAEDRYSIRAIASLYANAYSNRPSDASLSCSPCKYYSTKISIRQLVFSLSLFGNPPSLLVIGLPC